VWIEQPGFPWRVGKLGPETAWATIQLSDISKLFNMQHVVPYLAGIPRYVLTHFADSHRSSIHHHTELLYGI
jgi:hypothetical protein